MNKKFPPFGRLLNSRLKHGPIDDVVDIISGPDAWSAVKESKSGANYALVWDGDFRQYNWPVSGCMIRVLCGPETDSEIIKRFTAELLKAGAESVVLWPIGRENGMPIICYPSGRMAELELDDLRFVFGERA